MSQITVRNVDQDLKRLIAQHAKEKGVSINKYMLDIARESVNQTKPQATSWRECSGILKFEDFPDEVFTEFEEVDSEMWSQIMALKVALDTNIVTKILRGDHQTINKELDSIDTYVIPWAVQAELTAGSMAGADPARYLSALEIFFSKKYVVKSQEMGTEVIRAYSEIYAHLRKNGRPVSTNDMWIAAECITLGIPLLTLDKDFEVMPQVVLYSLRHLEN